MPKSSKTEQARRINTAVALLRKYPISKAVSVLAERYQISKRQAYRYVKDAKTGGDQIPVPDKKIAFTVKLPEDLTRSLRQHAKAKGLTLSAIVTKALETYLN